MNILVLGAGMYVTGRGGQGFGTILSSLAQASKCMKIDNITVTGKKAENDKVIRSTTRKLNKILKTEIRVKYKSSGRRSIGRLVENICKEEAFDCAFVVLPDHLHFEAAKALIENNVHLMVVKPLVTEMKQLRELLALQEKHNVYGAVEFHKRYDESNLFARKIVRENGLGNIQYITVDYSQRIHVPVNVFRQWISKTNVFQYLGVHYADIIYFVTGYYPLRLMAYGTEGKLAEYSVRALDSIHANIEWCSRGRNKRKFLSMINTNWIDPDCSTAMSDQKYTIVGTEGRLECDQKHRGIELVQGSSGVTHVNPYFSEYLYDDDGNINFQGYAYKSISRFLKDSILLKENRINWRDLEQSRPTFRDSMVSTAIVETVNSALKKPGKWLAINLPL